MTAKDKQNAIEKKSIILYRDNYTCQRCKKRLPLSELQLAHRIAKGNTIQVEAMLEKRFGREVTKKEVQNTIHHSFNLVTSCSKCNSSFNIANSPEKARKLIELIINCNDRLTAEEISEAIE